MLIMKINEIFYSLQGESSYVGHPTVFIRTTGCPFRCHYCDSAYAFFEGDKLTADQILTQVQQYPTKYVCVTGGEPLAQKSTLKLLTILCDLGYKVSLETSGGLSCKDVDPRVKKIIDIKTPDSGAFGSFKEENLKFSDVNTEFKFIICSEKDFDWAEDFVKANHLSEKFTVLYSASVPNVKEQWLANKILLSRSNARLQIQLHKFLWPNTEKGI